MNLMIIESPNKVKKLSEILGNGWKVTASIGHVRDLPDSELGVNTESFKPHYIETERGKSVIQKLKVLVNKADNVYLATDPDREGESISWHLKDALKLNTYERVTFAEITEKAVIESLSNPRQIDMKMVASQEARRILDRFVGYLVSPVLSMKQGESFSAGRVQSPAVRLVVDRENAINNFVVTNHLGVSLDFRVGENEWKANWLTAPSFVTDDEPYFFDLEFAEKIASLESVTVGDFLEKVSKKSPPKPLTTSLLIRAAGTRFGYTPKQVSEIAQALYEKGLVTYWRTDNPNISEEDLMDIYKVSLESGFEMAPEPRVFKAPEGAQQGHPAITPTNYFEVNLGSSLEEKNVYNLIRERAIGSQLADAEFSVRTAIMVAVVDGKECLFKSSSRKLVKSGWIKMVKADEDEEKLNDDDGFFPFLGKGEVLNVLSGNVIRKKTTAPSRFTLSSLVDALERNGIGRPSTFASIMENIVNKGYVKEVNNKKQIGATSRGVDLCQMLTPTMSFIDLDFTKNLEKQLDEIADGSSNYKRVVAQLYQTLSSEIKLLDKSVKPRFACVECGKALIHRVKKGKGAYDFWGCTGYVDGCKKSYKDDGGKPLL